MSAEEYLLETAVDDEDEEDGVEAIGRLERRHKRLGVKNKPIVNRFLGTGKREQGVGIVPRFYGELLTWALRRYMEKEGWQVVKTLGYHSHEPVFIDVNTDVKLDLLLWSEETREIFK